MDGKGGYFKPQEKAEVSARSVASYNNSFEALVKDLKQFKKKGYRVLLLSGSRTRAKRLAEDLREQELTAVYTENPQREIQPGEVLTYYGYVKKGFEYPLLKFVVLSETDIFGAEKKKKKARKLYQGQKIKDFNELRVGDYVVHETHGLGIYRGIEKVEMSGVVKDYIKIEYRDGRQSLCAGDGAGCDSEICFLRGEEAEAEQAGQQGMGENQDPCQGRCQ